MALTRVPGSGINATFGDAIANSINGGQLAGMRNRIINGDMRIDQRNNGAAVTPASGSMTYDVDRWGGQASQASKLTLQRNAAFVTTPNGLQYYLGATSSSAYAITSTDYFTVEQRIEGWNVADLAWGTASAKTITLSFRVWSSLTGTFGGALTNGGGARSYPFSYSVPVANTWTTVSFTVPGDTAGTWDYSTAIGVRVQFGLGVGSTYSSTAGGWAAGNFLSSTGAVSIIGTSGATFYITGVQFEVGTVATPLEQRPYGMELSLCQRYYVPLSGAYPGYYNTATNNIISIPLPVTMRTTPSVTLVGALTNINVNRPALSPETPTAATSSYQCSTNLTLSMTLAIGSTTGFGSFTQILSPTYLSVSAEM